MFNIEYETDSKEQSTAHVWQNSWGMTTRTIGVMLMTHGDDKGAVLPPRVAQVQAVVIPIINSKLSEEQVQALRDKAKELESVLKGAGVRVALDARTNYTPGWKYNHWELKVGGVLSCNYSYACCCCCMHQRRLIEFSTRSICR
jgi:prolyl-tRNA synthetase